MPDHALGDLAPSPATPLAGGSALYVSGEDVLRLVSYNSLSGLVLTIGGRILLRDGRVVAFQHSHTPNTDRTAKTEDFGISDGWLLSAQVTASTGAPRRGQCFVSLQFARGQTGAKVSLGTLAQGYVGTGYGIGWPGTAITSPVEGPGVIRSITGTNPAAGADIFETVPTNARWRLLSLVATLVTNAVAGARIPELILDNGALGHWRADPSGTQAANVTQRYTAGDGAGRYAATGSNSMWALPVDAMLMGGFRIATLTAALDAGDDWSAPQMLVEEWIED